jgi:CDP-glucose 4,6-dehydratase
MKACASPSADFWRGKRVLVTGHTGFKGGWLTMWLSSLGAEVVGISLPAVSQPNLYELAEIASICSSHFLDIRNSSTLANLVASVSPDIVFHLAAQPLVRASYRDPLTTYSTNVMGTANLLDALRGLDSVQAAVMVTTDKVYKNEEWVWPYRESDPLGGHDPYSASKAASEIVISSYRDAFLKAQDTKVASVRAGNVIGGGDWSEDRLIPDAVRAWSSGELLEIRRPDATRPWQHVLEPLSGYMVLAERLCQGTARAESYNFGPAFESVATVRRVVEIAQTAYGVGTVHFHVETRGPHEAGWLALDNAKANIALQVQPKWELSESVQRTMAWYAKHRDGANAATLCMDEISDYQKSG